MNPDLTPEDEAVRRALRRGAPPPRAYVALNELRPSMRRTRARRHLALSAATVALVVAGGAGVLAVATARSEPTRLSTSELPRAGEVLDEPDAPSTRPDTPSTTQAASGSIDDSGTGGVAPEPSSVPLEPTIDPTVAPTVTPTVTPPVIPPVLPPAPAPTTPPPAPTAPPTTPAPAVPTVEPPPTERVEPIASDCGVVRVGVQGTQIRIVALEPAAGFESRVSDPGPQSIELKFVSATTTCEIHVESKSDGLHIEVQDDS